MDAETLFIRTRYIIIILDITRAHSGAPVTQNKRDKTSRAGRDKFSVTKASSTDAMMMHTYHKPTRTMATLMTSFDIYKATQVAHVVLCAPKGAATKSFF